MLARRFEPAYLLVHSSSADTLGHLFTSQSAEYRIQVWQIDNALSRFIPRMVDQGYEVIVTADHGINADGHHGGNQPHLREIPFYYFGEKSGPAEGDILDQRAIAPTILSLIGVPAPATMKFTSLL
jgi:predicted AlkP superfamily pyrophosphatase or phosphodiesterase